MATVYLREVTVERVDLSTGVSHRSRERTLLIGDELAESLPSGEPSTLSEPRAESGEGGGGGGEPPSPEPSEPSGPTAQDWHGPYAWEPPEWEEAWTPPPDVFNVPADTPLRGVIRPPRRGPPAPPRQLPAPRPVALLEAARQPAPESHRLGS